LFHSVLMLLAIMTLYKCQVPPILEYACVVWDPHLKRDQLLLKSVPLFATRMAARSWTSDSESLNHHFQLPSLSSCRTYFKVLSDSTYKCLNSYTFCPPGNFSLHANPNLHVCHCKQLVVPFAKLLLVTIPFLLVLPGCGIPYLPTLFFVPM